MRLPLLLTAVLLAGLVPVAATAQTRTPPRRDWSTTVMPGVGAAWTIGNPAAKVKLVEWGSYTCPHCAHFATESRPVLEERMIRSGQVSLTVRHLIRDALDIGAVVVARCGGPAGFVRRHHAIFDAQGTWLDKGAAFLQANGEALTKLPRPTAFRRIADGAGLTAIGKASGLTEAQLAGCFSQAGLEAASKLGDPPAEVQGTPSFYVNGRFVDGADWAALQPQLVAAGAR